ncbi:MAG TPA: hypothetical protein VN455_03600 [Methanotrichaceae archaeon]|nr:hypothetical protein [Methanotrichaceae archaeon]
MDVEGMAELPDYYRESEYYRALVDGTGTGSIRLLKRVNFKILVRLFKEMLAETRKVNPEKARIVFYISPSLNEEMSDNSKEFLEFCRDCIGVDFEMIILE